MKSYRMPLRRWLPGLLLLIYGIFPVGSLAATLDYALDVNLLPAEGRLQAGLVMDVPERRKERGQVPEALELVLNQALALEAGAGVAALERVGSERAAVALTRYRLRPEPGATQLQLRWSGVIAQPLQDFGEGYGRRFEATPGMVSSQGVYLSGAAGWFPQFDDALYRFRLTVELPPGWDAVSQGRPLSGAQEQPVVWDSAQPQDDIYLIAARFTRYQQGAGGVLAQAFLREPDAALAARYLQATQRYVTLYSRLLGDYPYAKFALVENFWESGYGMPSFTLLGPRVLRLPFILHSSYPHEVLHNWWGNGVFVDFREGNWSEGLTAYLSDQLFQAQRGRGAAYRRDALQRYRDFAAAGGDFPLAEFTGRHGPVSQAVGYGKAMMLLHMLRRQLGDAVFLAGLRRFYADNRFRFAAWSDLQRAMEQVSGASLQGFFEQWLQRLGAPRLSVSGVSVDGGVGSDSGHWTLRGELGQQGSGAPWRLRVPMLVQLEGEAGWQQRVVMLDAASQGFALSFDQRPLRLRVDPRFDLFRLLDPGEVPPALSGLFGSPNPLVVLPASATPQERAAWRRMVQGWGAGGADWELISDAELAQLPAGRSVLLLGRGNRFAEQVAVGAAGPAPVAADAEHTAVMVARHPHHAQRVLVWIGGGDAAVRPALGHKLPHYGKYGYLGFRAASNISKGQWPLNASPLWVELPGATEAGDPPAMPAAAPLTRSGLAQQ